MNPLMEAHDNDSTRWEVVDLIGVLNETFDSVEHLLPAPGEVQPPAEAEALAHKTVQHFVKLMYMVGDIRDSIEEVKEAVADSIAAHQAYEADKAFEGLEGE